MSFSVAKLYRYPVKGLSAETLTAADLRPGRGIRFDRAFGLALSTTQYDPTVHVIMNPAAVFIKAATCERSGSARRLGVSPPPPRGAEEASGV